MIRHIHPSPYGYIDIVYAVPEKIGIVRSMELAGIIDREKENRIRLMKMVSINHRQMSYQYHKYDHPKYRNLLYSKKRW